MVAIGDKGVLLFGADGPVALFPCAGTPTPTQAVNPCDPDPEMLVTVTGASGTINWCGQTWNLPGDSGVQKSVCPTFYLLRQAGYATYIYPSDYYFGLEQWNYNYSLSLDRGYAFEPNSARTLFRRGGNAGNNYSLARINLGSFLFYTDRVRFTNNVFGVRPIPAAGTTSRYSYLGVLPPFATMYATDYRIRDGQFGSFTDASSITYTWARGAGW